MVDAVVSAIPAYFMSCLLLPDEFFQKVDALRHAFLWKNSQKVSGSHCLVAWDYVILPKEFRGLGVRNLKAHNIALIDLPLDLFLPVVFMVIVYYMASLKASVMHSF